MKLLFDNGVEVCTRLTILDTLDGTDAVKARGKLNNLRFDAGGIRTENAEASSRGISAFQQHAKLAQTASLDERTHAQIDRQYGSLLS